MDLEALYDEVFPSLFRYCRRPTGNPGVAGDLAQEAFVCILESRVVGERTAVRAGIGTAGAGVARGGLFATTGARRRPLAGAHHLTPQPLRSGTSVEIRYQVDWNRRALFGTIWIVGPNHPPRDDGPAPSARHTLEEPVVQFIDTPHHIADMGSYELWMTFFRDHARNPLALRSEVKK